MVRRGIIVAIWLLSLLAPRAIVFGQSIEEIQNSIRARGHKWIAGETSISVLPDHEKRRRLGLLKSKPTGNEPLLALEGLQAEVPASVDWRNYVTAPKNQGNCGSCWAFATTAALESNLLIRGRMPLTDDNRAEQILLSCSGAGNCERGGSISTASNYMKSAGLPPESFFPYTATDNLCSNALSGWMTATDKVASWSYVTTMPANLNAIKTALANNGPLVTTMDVYYDFYSYKGGIYEYSTGAYQGGHAVLIVGYTDDPSRPDGGYFTVKNSWGVGWGSGGFFSIGYSQLNSLVGFGEYTIAYSLPILPAAPITPSALTASAASSAQVNLAWIDNSSDESGFRIERCAGADCSNYGQIASVGANIVSFSDAGVSASSPYSYRVMAYNMGGDSGYSNIASATTPAALNPAAPSGLMAIAVSSSQINLSWNDNSNNETSFVIERCAGLNCASFSQIAAVGANVTNYNNTSLTANTIYVYRVKASNAGLNSGYAGPVSATTTIGSCSYAIAPASASFRSSGGDGTVSVTTSCSWKATRNASWITLKSSASGTGSGTISYHVSPYNGLRRTGTITIAGKIFTVTQTRR